MTAYVSTVPWHAPSRLVLDVLGEHHLPPPGQHGGPQLVMAQEDAIGSRRSVCTVCRRAKKDNQADERQHGANHQNDLNEHCASLHIKVQQHAANDNDSDQEKREACKREGGVFCFKGVSRISQRPRTNARQAMP